METFEHPTFIEGRNAWRQYKDTGKIQVSGLLFWAELKSVWKRRE